MPLAPTAAIAVRACARRRRRRMTKQDAFAPAESRSSALWGSGNRGGGQRSSALWGKGGRPFVVLAIAALALTAPLAATAGPSTAKVDKNATYISKWLLDQAKAHPSQKFHLIVQSNQGAT